MATKQSKIEITDRLRGLGAWDDASWFKDQCQKRLRASGMSRLEANERAWEQMETQFSGQNLEHYKTMRTLAMSEFPPMIDSDITDVDEEPLFAEVWQLWCYVLARLERWEDQDFDAAADITNLIAATDSDKRHSMASMAINDVNRFVQRIVAPKFQAVISRLESSNGPDQQLYVDELRSHVNEMQRFGL